MILLVVLFLSGLVFLEDLVFVVFIMVYMIFMNSIIFRFVIKGVLFNVMVGNKIVQVYFMVMVSVGLLLLFGYVLGGFVYGDQKVLKVVVLYLFFLGCQILSENVVFRNDYIFLLICVLVLIFYNVRRLFIIMEWWKVDVMKGEESFGMYGFQVQIFFFVDQWFKFGKYLVLVNMVVWIINFFFFLYWCFC